MERLTEAGSLYLNDYQILDEARKEVDRYLNSVVEEVNNIVSAEIPNILTEKYKINVWENKSSKGHFEVQFICMYDTSIMRRDKVDLSLIYKDIRNEYNINSASAKVYLYAPSIASKLENRLSKLSEEKIGENIFQQSIIEFDLNNSLSTAMKISSEMLNKTKSVVSFLEELD